MHSTVMVAVFIFPCVSVTVNHIRSYDFAGSVLETATHCKELGLGFFFKKWLIDECACFICGNSGDLHTWVFYLRLTCVIIS